MELHESMSAEIFLYSLAIAILTLFFLYITALLLKVRLKFLSKLLCLIVIAILVGFVVNLTWSKSVLDAAKVQLEKLHRSVENSNGFLVYNRFEENIFNDIELDNIFISDTKVISEIMTLLDNSSLSVVPATGIIATSSRFDFNIQNPTDITGFTIIANNVLEIYTGKQLYRYRSKNLQLYEKIMIVLRQSQLESNNAKLAL